MAERAYVALLLLAGRRSLPHEPTEAAATDGVSRRQVFWHITLSLLRRCIVVALLLRTIFEFRAFDNIDVMTSGAPADATVMLSMFTYLAPFVRSLRPGPGTPASWMLLMLLSMALCGLFIVVICRGRRSDARQRGTQDTETPRPLAGGEAEASRPP